MKRLDDIKQKREEILLKMSAAIKEDKPDDFVKAFEDLCQDVEKNVMDEAKGLLDQMDSRILVARGTRQLTSEEKNYYDKVINALRSSNPQQSLTELDVVLPKTTIDSVFEDLQANHPLLEAINFTNTSGLIEMIVNTNGTEMASWGTLTDAIVKELSSGFKKIDMKLNKLSAFLPVGKSMLDLGPAWMDKYVRTILAEAMANGLEFGILCGTGKDMPIGMNRKVGTGVTVTDGVYPEKDTISVVNLDPATYGGLLAMMAADPNGKQRVIQDLIMVVGPKDYFKKIMPSTTVRTPIGSYVNEVLPYPTRIIQSIHVAEGRAILGIAKKYFMGIGTEKNGRMEYSDHYKFLEDVRTYMIKLYGHGQPLDNNAFIYLDISDLEPLVQQVEVVGTVETKPVQ